MKSFLDYLSIVKADAKLKENTKICIETALADRANQQDCITPIMKFRKKSVTIKKMIIILSSVVACATFVFGGYVCYYTPVNYVSLDINPSVELGINAFDRIISAKDYNEDGTLLLKGNEYTHQTLENAIKALIKEATQQGFIKDGGYTVIAATIGSNNEKNAIALQYTCIAEINLALRAEEKSAVIYTDWINLKERTQAREAGISPGKYRMIEILQSLDSGVTIEQYRYTRITDIIIAAGKSLQGIEGGQKREFAEALERMRIALQQVQAAHREVGQEQNLNQNSDTGAQNNQNQSFGSAEKEQGQNINQYQNSGTTVTEQEQVQNLNQNQNSGTTVIQQEQVQNQNQIIDSSASADENGQSQTKPGQDGLEPESGKTESPQSSGANPSSAPSESGSGGKN